MAIPVRFRHLVLAAVGGSVVTLLAVAILGAAFPRAVAGEGPGTLRAQRVEIVDDEGRTRATLGVSGLGDPGLVLLDNDGKPRASLAMTRKGLSVVPVLTLVDAEGKEKMVVP